jgi:hypothetical protein
MKKNYCVVFFVCMSFFTLLSCNNYAGGDDPVKPKVSIVDDFAADVLDNSASAGVDFTRIKAVKLYNYWDDAGWANLPAKITFYTLDNVKITPKDGDLVFSDIPFKDFTIDSWGNSVEWTSAETGVYNGYPVTIDLRKTLDVSGYKRAVIAYVLEVDEPKVNGGGIQIAFIDKDGNESACMYLSTYVLR